MASLVSYQELAKHYDVPEAAIKMVIDVLAENDYAIRATWGSDVHIDMAIRDKKFEDRDDFLKKTGDPAEMLVQTMEYLKTTGIIQELRELPAPEAFSALARAYPGVESEDGFGPALKASYTHHVGGEEAVSRWPVLHPGDQGEDVKLLQRALGVKVTGSFDPMTEKYLVDFKKDAGLEEDGSVGAKVWKALGFPE